METPTEDTPPINSIKLIQARKSGNYIIFNKISPGIEKRILFKLENVSFPFGREIYNKKHICNIEISTNTEHNKIVINELIKLTAFFEEIKKKDELRYKYNLTNKNFYNFIKQSAISDADVSKYTIRTYLKYETPILNSKYVGTYNETDLRKQTALSVSIEIGSMWVNDTMYGINVYINEIMLK